MQGLGSRLTSTGTTIFAKYPVPVTCNARNSHAHIALEMFGLAMHQHNLELVAEFLLRPFCNDGRLSQKNAPQPHMQ